MKTLILTLSLLITSLAQAAPQIFETCVTPPSKSSSLEVFFSGESPHSYQALVTLKTYNKFGATTLETREAIQSKSTSDVILYVIPSVPGLSISYEMNGGRLGHNGRIQSRSMKGSLNRHLVCRSLL